MATNVPRIKLGSQGLEVSQQGLGANGMTIGSNSEQDMIDLIHSAVESGVTFIDTSDIYGPFTNEILIGKAMKGIREKVQLASKFGHTFKDGSMYIRGDPAYVQEALAGSLKRLDVDYIDLYYQHRVDPKVPIEITMGVLKKCVEEGKIKYIGLSEASSEDIRRAHAVHPITAVQLEWSLWTRDVEDDVVPTCRELGIGIVSYSPLGKGFFAGVKLNNLPDNDRRKVWHPRFHAENFKQNQVFYEKLVAISAKKNATPGQLALAWVHHRGKDVVPIPGTTKLKNLKENIGSLALQLTNDEIKEIEAAFPSTEIAGERYDAGLLKDTWKFVTSPPLSTWKDE